MDKIFVICNKLKEKDRYTNIEKIKKNSKIPTDIFEYCIKCWENNINKLDNFYFYENYKFQNLNKAEISLLINHIAVLKKIKKHYTKGIFLILESDTYVFPGMNFNKLYIDKLVEEQVKLDNWDFINIGARCGQIFSKHGYPKTQPIKIDTFSFFNENRIVCIEALVWNYNGICKFLDLFGDYCEKNKFITDPIDVILDNLTQKNELNIYWSKPSLLTQVSGSIFKSHLR